jgi:nucleoside-diphosphate-sugar epimerase
MIARIEAEEEPFAIFGADETRSFCYIDDAVEAIHKVMESKKTDGGTYHIGTKDETKIQELAEEIFEIMGKKPKKIIIKKSPIGSVKRRLADVSKIKKDTGWQAKTPLKKGLKKTVEWYRANPKPQIDQRKKLSQK